MLYDELDTELNTALAHFATKWFLYEEKVRMMPYKVEEALELLVHSDTCNKK